MALRTNFSPSGEPVGGRLVGDWYGIDAIEHATAINNMASSWVNVLDSGADPTGATGDLGAIITSLASTLHSAGGATIYVPPGTYRFTTTGLINSPKVSLVCAGASVVTFVPQASLGTLPCVDFSARTGWNVNYGGRFGGFSINGTSTPSGVGINYGDMIRGWLDDIWLYGYTSGTALQFINRVNWTERTLLTRVTSINNMVNWRFAISGGFDSFGYTRALDCSLNIDPVTASTSVASVTTTAGSTTATVASGGFPSVTADMSVDGAGLYGGTFVSSVSGNTLTLSIPAKSSGTTTLTFAPNCQTGILVDVGAHVYHSTFTLTANATPGTEGTNQSPILLRVQSGNIAGPTPGGLLETYFAVSGECSPGKCTAANVLANSALGGFGYTALPGYRGGYVASSGYMRLGGSADWKFINTNANLANTYGITDTNEWFYRAQQYGDSYDRLQIRPDAGIWWGGGTAYADTNLYRSAANVLKTDGTVHAVGGFTSSMNATGNYFLSTAVSSDSQLRLIIQADGTFMWSAGAGTLDTTLIRASPGVLKANGNIIRAGANVVSADTTLTADDYLNVLTGTVARTFTLPAVAGNTGVELLFKNRSTQTLTVQRAGSDQIYDTAAVNSFTVAAGGTASVINDGTYWLKV